mgnify:FL=1
MANGRKLFARSYTCKIALLSFDNGRDEKYIAAFLCLFFTQTTINKYLSYNGAMMDSLLLNIYWISLCFFAFIALFHYLLIKRTTLTPKQWAVVEYVWLILTFVSILGIIDDSRRIQAEIQLAQDLSTVKERQLRVFNWLDNYQEYTCSIGEKTKGCVVIKSIVTNVNLSLVDEFKYDPLPLNLFESLTTITPLISDKAQQVLTERTKQYNQAVSQYKHTFKASLRSYLRNLLAAFTPLIFCCALALKITKVSSEYIATP